MRKSKTRYVILGLLSEGNLSGYEIKKIVDLRFSHFWSESFGQIFPELKKLLEQGLIEMAEKKGQRDKTTYAITQKGMEELLQWLELPVEKDNVRIELLLKMYFSGLGDKKTIQKHVETYQKTYTQKLQVLGAFTHELEAIRDLHHNHGDILRVIDFGRKTYQAYIDWCSETLEYLKGRP